MLITSTKTRTFIEGEDLFLFITSYIKKVPESSIIVVTSKIVALAEERTVVIKNSKTREQMIHAESDLAIRTKYTWLTLKDGIIVPSAGIDESNANGKLILLPKDSFAAADTLRKQLKKYYQVKKLGVIVTDSRIMPFRSGVVGVALGYAGFVGYKSYRGTPDIYGRILQFASTNIADSLATAAVLLMGEGNEKQPLALIKNVPVKFREKVDQNELKIDIKEDLFRPFFQKFLK